MTDTSQAIEFLRGAQTETTDDPRARALEFLRAREGALQRFEEAAPGPSEGLELGTRRVRERGQALEALSAEGVDITSGDAAGFGLRAEMAFTPQERIKTFLDNHFPEGYRQTEAGLVVRVPDGMGKTREVLLDESGFTLRDIGDAAPEIAEALGATLAAGGAVVAAPALATGGVLSLLGLAVTAGVGGQITAGTGDVVATMRNGGLDLTKQEDRDLLAEIALTRGLNAAIDTAMDFALAGGGRLIKGAAQRVVGPFARRMGISPQKDVIEAAERRGVELSPGTATGSPTVQRAEALLERVPGGKGPIQVARERESRQMQEAADRLQEGAIPATRFGEDVSDTLTAAREVGMEEVKAARRQAETIANERIEQLQRTMATRSLSVNEAGELSRRLIERARIRFRARQDALSQRTTSLVGRLDPEQQKFVSMQGVKRVAIELRDELPKHKVIEKEPPLMDDFGPVAPGAERVREEVIPELFPASARRFIKGIEKLPDKVTPDQLRRVRNVLSNMINNAEQFPGISVGMLKKMEASMTEALQTAIANAPNAEVGAALARELAHFRDNVGQFRNKIVARALRGPDQPGFVEGSDVLPNLFLSNRPEDVRRVLAVIGPGSTAAQASRRAVFEHMLTESRDSLLGPGVIDARALARQIDRLSPETQELLFAGSREQVVELVRTIAAKQGHIDVSELSATVGTRDIVTLLRTAAAKEAELARTFDRTVFKRILRNEIDATQMRPDQFVRFTLRDATPQEIDTLFKILPPEQVAQFRLQTVVHLLERSGSRAELDEGFQAIFKGQIPVGDNLLRVLGEQAGTTKDSIIKLKAVLGEDVYSVVRDLALIQAARQQRDKSTAAMGGLVGGSVLSSILSFQFSTASKIIGYRIVAGLLNFPPTRAWMTSSLNLGNRNAAIQTGMVVLPQYIRALEQTLGEDAPEVDLARELFGDIESLIPRGEK